MADLGIEGEWVDLAVMGVGAGAKATIEDWVTTQFPQVPVEYAGIIAGFLLYKFGDRVHRMLRIAGAGVLIGSIGQLDIVKGLLPAPATATSTGGSSSTGGSPQTLGDLARLESQRTLAVV